MLLSVESVGITFGGVRALRDVSLGIPRAAIFSVIGPNGAGKTTLFNCVTGVYRPSEGRVRFAGHDITGLAPHRIAELGLARTFQNIELFANMTVAENVLLGRHRHMSLGPFGAAWFGRKAREEEAAQRHKTEEILAFLDLAPYRHRLVSELAYGVRKKVELGRALALEPLLLLLDEPSAGMNAEEKRDLMQAILDVRSELGTAIVLVEHDMGLVMEISDRIVVLDHGERIAEGTPDEVARDPEVLRAYLGTDETAQSALSPPAPGDEAAP